MVKFWINERTTSAHDFVKPIDILIDLSLDKSLFISGKDAVVIPVKKLTQYYDVESKEFKVQEFIELQLKIVSEKLDEVAKDENVESGVEDSETEEN